MGQELDSYDFEKMKNNLYKSGFREGLSVGKEKNLQNAFNKGYISSFQIYKSLGILRGTLSALICSELVNNADNSMIVDDLKLLLNDVLQINEKIYNFKNNITNIQYMKPSCKCRDETKEDKELSKFSENEQNELGMLSANK